MEIWPLAVNRVGIITQAGSVWRTLEVKFRSYSELSSSSHLLEEAGISSASWLGCSDVPSCDMSWESAICGLRRQISDSILMVLYFSYAVVRQQVEGSSWRIVFSVPPCVQRRAGIGLHGDVTHRDDVSTMWRSCLPPVHLLLLWPVDIHLRNWEFCRQHRVFGTRPTFKVLLNERQIFLLWTDLLPPSLDSGLQQLWIEQQPVVLLSESSQPDCGNAGTITAHESTAGCSRSHPRRRTRVPSCSRQSTCYPRRQPVRRKRVLTEVSPPNSVSSDQNWRRRMCGICKSFLKPVNMRKGVSYMLCGACSGRFILYPLFRAE